MSALWTATALQEATGGRFTRPFAATGIAIDTRGLIPGEMFVALQGEHRDGHAFIPAALQAGAAGALAQHGAPDLPLLLVEDTLAGLTALGRAGRARFTGKLAAITGSVGKTTTKEMLRTILAAVGLTHAASASHNNQWGVPLTLARLPADAAFCVAELGMNHAGEIEPLARLARPHVAIVTAIAPAHIGHLGSIEAIADEKAAILRGLEPGGAAILPADSDQFPRLRDAARQAYARIVSFGAASDADFRLDAAEVTAEATTLRATCPGVTVTIRLAAPGRHMALNALAALAAAAALGIPPGQAAAALDGFAPLAGRGARRDIAVPGGRALLLDESYNANGASMHAALAVLAAQPGRRIAVLGDMLELGAHAAAEHAALAEAVTDAADRVFLCGTQMRHLRDALPNPATIAYAPDSAALAPLLAQAVRPGDAILVKGSLGSRMNIVVAALARLAEGG